LEDFFENGEAEQFENNTDFQETRDFFLNNNATDFINNQTAQVLMTKCMMLDPQV